MEEKGRVDRGKEGKEGKGKKRSVAGGWKLKGEREGGWRWT